MKILVTGAKGFVGKNLCLALSRMEGVEILPFDLDNTKDELVKWAGECDFVFHLAGVNRPKDPGEFKAGNTVFTEDLLELLAPRKVPVMLSSSTQAALDNDYGRSKKAAEEAVFAYGAQTGAAVYVYRFANVFGKWCRPNYNSAVATWCHNIAHDLPIMVRDPAATVTLIYIDDVVNALVSHLGASHTATPPEILSVAPSYTKTLGEITALIESFRKEPEDLMVPNQADEFARKLYATYLSYLPEDRFSYPVTMHCDARGSFTELLHTAERGQVSVNISKPGITKGQHWHHTKHEKFCVVSGRGLIQFRKMDVPNAPVIDYHVSGDKIEVVRIPPGYTHNIINEGDTDMVTVMWANEIFDPQKPDTFFEKV
ncbi:MAG: NAD-dependent epimerase/dehydratase family protein [Kiritimatiellae bacterium]|nr:NAD-dependent epimerase/dehydratase family protein [Kiritimatiellia bacterium]